MCHKNPFNAFHYQWRQFNIAHGSVCDFRCRHERKIASKFVNPFNIFFAFINGSMGVFGCWPCFHYVAIQSHKRAEISIICTSFLVSHFPLSAFQTFPPSLINICILNTHFKHTFCAQKCRIRRNSTKGTFNYNLQCDRRAQSRHFY